LSLLGFYPEDDYEYLVIEDRGRRVFPADPEFSLLLLKPSNQLPHGGGQRLDVGSFEWDLLTSWIRQGMPQGAPDDPVLESVEVFPKSRSMNRFTRQQLAAVGHYSDGTTRDVTHLASYEANLKDMAFANSDAEIEVNDIPGDVAIMVRFQGEVTVFRAELPLGVPVTQLPPGKNFIDEHVFGKLKHLGIPPSQICDDATFVRRIYVDITGRLPTADEAKAFVADTDPAKRDKLIDQLVDSPGYADYFANKWSTVLRVRRRDQNDVAYTFRFHNWIRQALQDNMPYDEFVRNVLAGTGDVQAHPPVAWYREVSTSTQQMEDTAQLFLGMRLQCAKCHHHPFERWSQNDYYGFEAFFSQVGLRQSKFNMAQNIPDEVYLRGNVPQSRNPRTNSDVKPAGLGDEPLDIPAYEDARQYLVDWMSDPDNPYFAPALVNRYWKHFFGRGIVDPEDDMRVTNPPANPELLAALSQHFIDSKFNLKDLVRTICRSSAYQLSSEPNEFNLQDKQNFSSFYPRRLTAEVLYDAINQVSGVPANFNGVPSDTLAVQLPDNGFNNYFLTVFGKPEATSACECERRPEANLAQSLHLLNSADIQGRLGFGNGRAAELARQQDLTDEQRISELYYWALARPPKPEELKFVFDEIKLKYTDGNNKQQAFEDLLWALLNTKEFLFVR